MAKGVTTEWEDQMVKRGIWTERENVDPTAEQIFEVQQENVENYNNWENHNKKQLAVAITT